MGQEYNIAKLLVKLLLSCFTGKQNQQNQQQQQQQHNQPPHVYNQSGGYHNQQNIKPHRLNAHAAYYAAPGTAPPSQFQVQAVSSSQVSTSNVKNVNDAFARLWELDSRDRLVVGKDVRLNLQNSVKVSDNVDKCSKPLFDNSFNLNKTVSKVPTMATFYSLLDNYQSDNGIQENIGSRELNEERKFIAELLAQPTIQFVFNYLRNNSKKFRAQYPDCNSLALFGNVLGRVWFSLYKRVVYDDSSAFEHTFVGEINTEKGQVIGMHNWVMVCREERAGRIDYQGYIPRRQGGKVLNSESDAQILSFQVRWKNYTKPVSTFFIGSSPHFEIALYTLIFLDSNNEDNFVTLPTPYNVRLNIKCHRFDNKMGQQLGSIYPEVRKN